MSAFHPPFPASAVEVICRELAEHVTGAQIPNLIAPLKTIEPPSSDGGTKWKRLFNVVGECQNRQGDGRPLLRLIGEVMAPVRFASADQFQEACRALNARLLFYGYQVLEDGRVGRTHRAATIDEAQERADDLAAALRQRDIHPRVLDFCRPELLRQNYFHAVLEACKSVADRVRQMTGLAEDGAKLFDLATSTKHGPPKLAFNDLSTEWGRSEHTGLAMIAKGLFSAVRNPTAHAPKVRWAVDRRDALDILTLVSLLHRRLDQASTE